ncbi:MAG TPA: phage tail sheath subtilisin-like domain-containing protein [Meiothermus sp.]|jgi:phage tail sheath protein FI|nr:phage tail sheath subtilisin-like domain-containing protein [Meiothermus sp.]
MPEYLAPGVYIEETSFRSKSIEGVSTTTTGFIGPCRFGPVDLTPEIITSLVEFERIYGDGQPLEFQDSAGEYELPNYLWQAVRAFFTEGGKRLYVSRVFKGRSESDRGYSKKTLGGLTVRARFPGGMGNYRVRLKIQARPNILGQLVDSSGNTQQTVGALQENDLVFIRDETSPPSSPPVSGDFYLARFNQAVTPPRWEFVGVTGSPIASPLETAKPISDLVNPSTPDAGDALRVVTLAVTVIAPNGQELGTWGDLPLDPNHKLGDSPDSAFELFSRTQEDRNVPIVLEKGSLQNGLDVLDALFGDAINQIGQEDLLLKGVEKEVVLEGGNDGDRPGSGDYEGKADPDSTFKTGLKQFEDLEDISIVAAPGSTALYDGDENKKHVYRDDANTIMGQLIAHASNMRYRIAVLDSAPGHSVGQVRKVRAKLDSKYAAFYYPWVKILDPITRKPAYMPPSGFVAGIYARNDINRAVYKAPANEVVNLALGFEVFLNKAQQEVLNPEGVNCFRFFEGRGMLLWGARTISSDPEWKYVNLRRYFAYLERSIEKGTQWAVFEPNGNLLWDNVRRTIDDFLFNEWQMGALLGDKPEKAYFVRCDRSTMTQNDLDNGRLVCLIGVAVVRPAEFVIFRIGQWTGDAKR